MSSRSTVDNHPHIVLDTSAVLEIIQGTPRGKQAERLIGDRTITLPTIVIAEACAVAQRSDKDAKSLFRLLLSEAHVVHLSSKTAYNAAILYALAKQKKPKFSLADAIVVMTGDELSVTVITCDNDFAGMKNVTVVR